MVILDPYGMFFDAMGVFGLAFHFLFKSCLSTQWAENYDNSASTFFYDHKEGEWINGPSLMQARIKHAAGIVTDEVTGEDFVAVTGGGSGYSSGYLDSTEILQDGEWIQGKINNAICHLLESCWLHNSLQPMFAMFEIG